MRKNHILSVLVGTLPSYFACFSDSTTAAVVLFFTTLIGIFATIGAREGGWIEALKLGWISHLLGIAVTIAVHA